MKYYDNIKAEMLKIMDEKKNDTLALLSGQLETLKSVYSHLENQSEATFKETLSIRLFHAENSLPTDFTALQFSSKPSSTKSASVKSAFTEFTSSSTRNS